MSRWIPGASLRTSTRSAGGLASAIPVTNSSASAGRRISALNQDRDGARVEVVGRRGERLLRAGLDEVPLRLEEGGGVAGAVPALAGEVRRQGEADLPGPAVVGHQDRAR